VLIEHEGKKAHESADISAKLRSEVLVCRMNPKNKHWLLEK